MRHFSLCTLLMVLWGHIASAQPAKSGKVGLHNGRPTFFVNDQPTTPQIYALTHVYGGRWSWEERPSRNLANFCEIGFRLFQVDLYLADIWHPDKPNLDMDKAKRQLQGVLDVCPEAAIIVRVHVNAPFWWNDRHPGELTAYADGPLDQRRYGPPFNMEDGDVGRAVRASMASVQWRLDASQRLKEFCEKLAKTPQGKAVVGMHIAGGIYGEWHNWGFIKNEPDCGPAMTAYFRTWLTKKYTNDQALQAAWRTPSHTLKTATVPDTTERKACADGEFRATQSEQRVVDFYMAQQELIADNVVHFCQIAKKNWPRPLIVGVFYGYFHFTLSRQAIGGHLMVERLLNCTDIDYLAGPPSYLDESRKMGGSGMPRGIVESTLRHGKLWIDEVDNGYLQEKKDWDFVRSGELQDTQYAQILRRCTALPLLRGSGYWLYDFGPQRSAGWWDSPYYLEQIKADFEFWQKQMAQPYRPAADVLFVYDQQAFFYQKNQKTPISGLVPDQSIEHAMKSGAVGDHVYLFDLPNLDLTPYKAVFFVNCYYMSQAQRQFIQEEVAQNGRTLIWNYLPGYTDGQVNSLPGVSALTGFRLEGIPSPAKPAMTTAAGTFTLDGMLQPLAAIREEGTCLGHLNDADSTCVLAQKEWPTHRAIMATMPLQGSALFRQLFEAAGCHIYAQTDDLVYANQHLLLFHTAKPGPKTITLKSGKQVQLMVKKAITLVLDAETGAVLVGE